MSCENCEEEIKYTIRDNIPIAYVRIDNANMVIVGCVKHIKRALELVKKGYKYEKSRRNI